MYLKQITNKDLCSTGKYTQYFVITYKGIVEEEMETHSSILAWRIPWTEEPDGLQSMGSQSLT